MGKYITINVIKMWKNKIEYTLLEYLKLWKDKCKMHPFCQNVN